MSSASVGKEPLSSALRFANYLFVYRIPVYLLTFLLIVAPLPKSVLQTHPELVAIALCFSSLMAFVYLLNKVTDTVEDSVNLRGGPIDQRTSRPTLALALLCLVIPVFYLIRFPILLPLYGAVAALGFLYSYKIPLGERRFRLKDILFVKNTTSTLIWVLPPVGVYALMLPGLAPAFLWTYFTSLFCIFFVFESLWDIRDMEGDRRAGVQTIANTFGIRTTQVIETVLVAIYFLLTDHSGLGAIFTLAALLSLVFIWTANPKRGAWFYHAMVLMWAAALGFLYLMK